MPLLLRVQPRRPLQMIHRGGRQCRPIFETGVEMSEDLPGDDGGAKRACWQAGLQSRRRSAATASEPAAFLRMRSEGEPSEATVGFRPGPSEYAVDLPSA